MSEKSSGAVKAVSFMMIITLVGKVLGLIRDQFLAANYGLGMEASAFLVASRIPRTFFDAVFASAISASFIPIFNEYLQKKGKKEAFSLANRFITLICMVTLIMTILGVVFADQFVWLFAEGFDGETAALSAALSRMLFPTILFTAMAFSYVGILQSLGEFNIPAAISVASNAVIILYYILFNERFGIYGLTVAFLVGWALQAIIQIPSLRKKGYGFFPDFHFRDEGLKKIGRLMLPVMVSTWIQPINFVINCRFASQLYDGRQGVSALEYANNLYTIIVGVFVLAVANLIFPKLSRITDNKAEFGSAVRTTLRSMLFLLIPMMVGMMALAKPLVSLIYERGGFDQTATDITSTALFFFSVGVIGYGVQTILSRAFYADQDGKMPFFSGLAAVATNALLCLLLIKPMGIGGLALSAAVSSIVSAGVLFVPAARKYEGILDISLIKGLIKMAVSALIMLVFVKAGYGLMSSLLGAGAINKIIILGVSVGVGVGVYMTAAALLGVDEGKMVFSLLRGMNKKEPDGENAPPEDSGRNKNERRVYRHMTEDISNIIEDSFFFKLISRILSVLWRIWTGSLFYFLYRRIAVAVGQGFSNSGILGFFRKDWSRALALGQGIAPRTWRRLTLVSARAIKEKKNLLAKGLGESFFLRIFNQNFLLLCLAALVFAVPLLPTMLLALLSFGTLAVYGINLFMGRIRIWAASLVSLFMGLFGIVLIYASLTSYNFPKALQVMAIFLVFMSMFFVAKDVIDTEEKLNFIMFVMIAAGVLIALYAVYQYIVGVEMDAAWVDAESFDITTRAYATFNNPNVLGEYLILIGSLAAGMLWKVRNWFGRLFYAACFGVICLGLLATNSRGAMLGLMFAAGLFVLLAERRLIPVGILAMLAMPFILPQSIWTRLISAITMSDSSSQYRLSIYQAGMEMAAKYWPTGIGVDSFNQIYPLFSLEAANAYHVHNLFLQELIEMGFLGLGVLLLLFIVFFQGLYSAMQRVPKRFRMLLATFFGGFAGLLLQSMTDHIWFDYSIVLIFWCFMGIAMACVRVGEKACRKEK